MSNAKWKDFLLKSGLPLEYEVKEFLDSQNCVSSFDYSYFRNDENSIINEFSFDINAAYIEKNHFFKLAIECKYRDRSTNWLFLPGTYGGMSELGHTSFLHPLDHFTKHTKFPFKYPELPPIGKACLKGIEITSDGQNPKTITQAVNQLSYAMAEMVVEDMISQIEEHLATSEMIFYNVPIIVTTANLFRLNENVTIEMIKETDKLSEIATEEDCLIIDSKIGKDLERHNKGVFTNFINEYGKNNLNKKLKSFNDDIDFLTDVISSNYAPQAILVLKHTPDNIAFKKLFQLIKEVINPSKKTIEYFKQENKRITEIAKKIQNTIGKKSSK